MITRLDAEREAARYVRLLAAQSGIELAVVADETIERAFGWMFFYVPKRYLETGDWRDSVGGNAPLIVDRIDGSLHVTGTARDPEDYLAAYEALGRDGFDSQRLADFLNALPSEPFGASG